jgi:hypothetical protein
MGLDVADGYIAKSADAGDLAITADIPLAAALVARGAVALDPRGTVYTAENVGEALASATRTSTPRPMPLAALQAAEADRRARYPDPFGFSLHSGVHIHANDRPGLEGLCRYALRPAALAAAPLPG